jgi:SPP1 family phage portal protein
MDFNSYKYAEMIDSQGINTKIISDIISDYESTKADLMLKYGRYKQAKEATPILTREFTGAAAKKINNKLANDYLAEIVDTKTGYMFGVPVTVNYEKKAAEYKSVDELIQRFEKVNNFDDFNAEMSKFAAICGFDTAICFIDKEAQERVMRVDPWETIVISKTNMMEPEYGLLYYETWDEKKRVEFYDGTYKTVYEGGSFSAAALAEVEKKPHMFDYCPVFGVPNNAELLGDADKVITLIDAFDRSLSDMNNEIEQFRAAYMKFIGYQPDDTEIEAMIKTGALYLPDSEGDVGWLVKDLNPAYIDSHLNRLEANITRFAKHVNFTDAAFGSDITGPAMRYKLFALETKAKYFERKHESALQHMFKVLGSAWSKKGIAFDYTKLDIVYTRNIPVNIVDEANAATSLRGAGVSQRTVLGTLSFIKDVDEEMDLIAQEKEDMINLDDPALNDNLDKNKDGANN